MEVGGDDGRQSNLLTNVCFLSTTINDVLKDLHYRRVASAHQPSKAMNTGDSESTTASGLQDTVDTFKTLKIEKCPQQRDLQCTNTSQRYRISFATSYPFFPTKAGLPPLSFLTPHTLLLSCTHSTFFLGCGYISESPVQRQHVL